jgi:8-oxo-dGTP pyrophosphatase MutT (NUDIX family)
MPRPWELIASEKLSRLRVFDARREWAVSPRTGAVRPFVVLEGRDWVNVIPFTDDGGIVLVRQYRHGAKEVTLEIPGGVVERAERADRAARRELLEETGFAARSLAPLGWVHPNPAIQTNRCYTLLATGCHEVAQPAPDDGEDLEPVVMPIGAIPRLIARGEITHALVLAAFSRYFAAAGALRSTGASPIGRRSRRR